jgi:hypothetical protein
MPFDRLVVGVRALPVPGLVVAVRAAVPGVDPPGVDEGEDGPDATVEVVSDGTAVVSVPPVDGDRAVVESLSPS